MNTPVFAPAGLTQFKKGALTLAAGAVLGLSSFAASAVDVNFVGYTNGCFGLACVPVANSAPTAITLAGSGLTYDNSTFNVTTSGGFVAIGSVPPPNFNNLGSFTLTGDAFNYVGNFFDLLVTFTVPSGAGPATFTSVCHLVATKFRGWRSRVSEASSMASPQCGLPSMAVKGRVVRRRDMAAPAVGSADEKIITCSRSRNQRMVSEVPRAVDS